jgi:hypothetical protein
MAYISQAVTNQYTIMNMNATDNFNQNTGMQADNNYANYEIQGSHYYDGKGYMHVHCGQYGQGIVKAINHVDGMATVKLRWGGVINIQISKIKYHEQHNLFSGPAIKSNNPNNNEMNLLKRSNNNLSDGNTTPDNDMDTDMDDTCSMSTIDNTCRNNNKRMRPNFGDE